MGVLLCLRFSMVDRWGVIKIEHPESRLELLVEWRGQKDESVTCCQFYLQAQVIRIIFLPADVMLAWALGLFDDLGWSLDDNCCIFFCLVLSKKTLIIVAFVEIVTFNIAWKNFLGFDVRVKHVLGMFREGLLRKNWSGHLRLRLMLHIFIFECIKNWLGLDQFLIHQSQDSG